MRVHAASVLPKDRLRHERRDETELLSDLFHDEAEGRDVIGGLECISVAEVDLVLAMRDLVVRRLDLELHPLQNVDHRAPRLLPQSSRRLYAVAATVVRFGPWHYVYVCACPYT